MPNWCYNTLTIKALKKDIPKLDLFILAAVSKNTDDGRPMNQLDFNSFIPYPEEWRELDKKDPNASFNLKHEEYTKEANKLDIPLEIDGCKTGYDWCCKNWGTKWNSRDVEINTEEKDKGKIKYFFETAWCPPSNIIMKMSELFPDFKFIIDYHIEGNPDSCRVIIKNNEILNVIER